VLESCKCLLVRQVLREKISRDIEVHNMNNKLPSKNRYWKRMTLTLEKEVESLSMLEFLFFGVEKEKVLEVAEVVVGLYVMELMWLFLDWKEDFHLNLN